MHDTDLVKNFLRCCLRFLRGDAEFLHALRQHNFYSTIDEWQFTLPALHRFLCADMSDGTSDGITIDYKQFRQQLFNSTVNTRLQLWQAEIIIAQNVGKTDLNIYALRFHHHD